MINQAVPSPHQAFTSSVTESAASLSAIVLAGGKSSRMGRDKALIEIAGVPMLQRVCAAALQCTPEVYVVTAWGDRYRSILPPSCQIIPETLLPGEKQPAGPLVGFGQGLALIKMEWVLLLACDLPQLQGEVLRQWSEELAHVLPESIALLPRSFKGWEPLCGFYRRSCLISLQSFIRMGGRSFQDWLTQQSVAVLSSVDQQMLLNCNTPEDVKQVIL